MTTQTTYLEVLAEQAVTLNDAYIDGLIDKADWAVAIAQINTQLDLIGATWDDVVNIPIHK